MITPCTIDDDLANIVSCSTVFCHPLTKLLNMSIVHGVFPRKWKIARATLLYKTGSRDLEKEL